MIISSHARGSARSQVSGFAKSLQSDLILSFEHIMNVLHGLLLVVEISSLCELVNINLVCSRINSGSCCSKIRGVSLNPENS